MCLSVMTNYADYAVHRIICTSPSQIYITTTSNTVITVVITIIIIVVLVIALLAVLPLSPFESEPPNR